MGDSHHARQVFDLVEHDCESRLLVIDPGSTGSSYAGVIFGGVLPVGIGEVGSCSRSTNTSLGRVQENHRRRRHESEDQSFQDEHGKHALGQDSGSEADIEDNQLYETRQTMRLGETAENNTTDPLQLIRDPIVLASRQLKPAILAATVHPKNLPKYDRQQIAMVKPHVIPAVTLSVSGGRSSRKNNTIVKQT